MPPGEQLRRLEYPAVDWSRTVDVARLQGYQVDMITMSMGFPAILEWQRELRLKVKTSELVQIPRWA
jgi:hypothetical protein